MLRIIIQKQRGTEWHNTELEYTFEQVFEILRARMHESLSLKEKEIKGLFGKIKAIDRTYTIPEIESSLEEAAKYFVDTFKFKTVSLP